MRKLVRRGLLFVGFLLVLQLLVGTTVVLADPDYHVVRPGETLFSIGRIYGVNPYVIAQANGLPNPNYIQIGQILYIPGGSVGWYGWPAPSYAPPRPYYYPPTYYWYGPSWYRLYYPSWYRPYYGWQWCRWDP